MAGLISSGGARLLTTWRDRSRARDLDRGGKLASPCALRDVEGDKARWRHGTVTSEGESVVWRSRTGKGRVAFHRDGVHLLTTRRPTLRESWSIREKLVIMRVRSEAGLMDLAMLPVEARYFRTALGLAAD